MAAASPHSFDYDYIITGSGCAGLSLAMHLISSGKFSDKKILIIDKDAKQKNDRTWCFWEKEAGLFQAIVYKEWNLLLVQAPSFSKELAIKPYTYKLIRGIDFYTYCMEQIKKHPNITFLQAGVENIISTEEETVVVADGKRLHCRFVFNSILFTKPSLAKGDIWMLQHFKGWFIKSSAAIFDPAVATIMDFNADQKEGTTFFYLLPFSPTSALVEYTLFSEKILPDDAYENALKQYVEALPGIEEYTISEKEFGVIPMTNHRFIKTDKSIVHIGTAGGQTKGSSGYTFRFIQKQVAAIVKSLEETGHPFTVKKGSKRFSFYDSVLLNVLKEKKVTGREVFTTLFQKNDPESVLRFLDNESTLAEEISIISSLPKPPFMQAALRHTIARF